MCEEKCLRSWGVSSWTSSWNVYIYLYIWYSGCSSLLPRHDWFSYWPHEIPSTLSSIVAKVIIPRIPIVGYVSAIPPFDSQPQGISSPDVLQRFFFSSVRIAFWHQNGQDVIKVSYPTLIQLFWNWKTSIFSYSTVRSSSYDMYTWAIYSTSFA